MMGSVTVPGLVDSLHGMTWSQILPFLIGGVGLIVNFVSGSLSWGTRRRIDEMSKIHERLPEACRGKLEDVISAEVARYVQTVERRASRHLDVERAVTVLLIFSAGVFILGGLLQAVVEWGWLMWIPTIVFIMVFLIVMSAGSMSVVYYGDEPPRVRRKRERLTAQGKLHRNVTS